MVTLLHHLPLFKTLEAIEHLEKRYNASYVFDTCKVEANVFENIPMSVFYCKEKHPKGSHYLGVKRGFECVYLLDALPHIKNRIYTGVESSGGLFYSSFRQDFNKQGEFFIDGGSDYVRSNSHKLKRFMICGNGKVGLVR